MRLSFNKHWWQHLDWLLFLATLPLLAAGLVTMSSFTSESYFFNRQLIWVAIAVGLFFLCSWIDWRFLRRSIAVMSIFILGNLSLLGLMIWGQVVKGAQSWFSLGTVSLQPADFVKLALILVLAKYFSRRHVEIAHIKHIVVSGIYTLIPFGLIFFQPDFGSAVVIFLIWFGLIIFSGISKKHLLSVLGTGILLGVLGWFFVLAPYQKDRIVSFIHPLADIQGTGYNAYQSTIAVGSGQIWGKGVGYGTQSRLKFLPEYQTDFIFAAFAEEWGFIGVLFFFTSFGIVIWRIIYNSIIAETNFEALFGIGVAIIFMSHFTVNIGMNIGLLPVTGLTLPLVSYGGSHLLVEFIALGMLQGMRRYSRGFHRDDMKNEFLGVG